MQVRNSCVCFWPIPCKNKTNPDVSLIHRVAARLKPIFPLAMVLCVALAGCGGSSSSSSAPSFTLQVVPSTVSLVPGGSQAVTLVASPSSGFSQQVSVAIGTLPAGVTATPSTLTLNPGVLQQIMISASSSAAAGNSTITFTATSGSLSESASSSLAVGSPTTVTTTTATVSTSEFDFGENIVNNTVTQTVATVTNTGTNALTMSPALSGDASYKIVSGQSCGTTLAAGASCNMVVSYDPTVASTPHEQSATLNMGFGDVPASTQQTVGITGISGALSAGTVTTTDNPQVALYTMTLPFPGSMTVNFGTTTSYGRSTWTQSTDTAGGQVSIFVAGMLQRTAYHMDATVQLANGVTVTDVDHTFTTGAITTNLPNLTATTTPGMTPQPGLELLDPLGAIDIVDLSGNILWNYSNPSYSAGVDVQGVKMLPNGDILMAISPESNASLPAPAGLGGVPATSIDEIREVNLAGDTVREITMNDLNVELANATCAECNVTLQNFHHDVTPLPNGHWLVLASTLMNLSESTTPSLTGVSTAEPVLGDVIVDLDQNLQPVWAWNEFNHLDVNRQPMNFPDWTHTNAIVYSPDDGNILVSIRHQNWVVKVNYDNGTGNGDIIWKLGYQGSFTLQAGPGLTVTSPTDWQYAQHGPSFFSTNTSGVFSLGLMDNGNDRQFPSGVTCSTLPTTCYYSTVPIFQIDETAMTATETFHQVLPVWNQWGGNAELMANGDVEYDVSGLTTGSNVYEVTQSTTPQTVWELSISGGNVNFYRAFRIPSLYPNVQW